MKRFVLYLLATLIILSPSFTYAVDWTVPKQNLDLDPSVSDFSSSNSGSFVVELNEPGEITSSVAKDGILYFAEYHSTTRDSYVRAISIYSGAEVWTEYFPRKTEGLVINGNEIYVGADLLYSFNRITGEVLWSLNQNCYGGSITSAKPLSIVDNHLFVTMNVNSSASLNIYNLESSGFEVLSEKYNVSGTEIMADKNQIYIVYSRNTFYSRVDAYDRENMEFVWSSNWCGDNATYSLLDQVNNVIYIGSNASKFCGYDTSTGSSLFQRANSFKKGLVTYGNKAYGFDTPQYTNDRGIMKSVFLSERDGLVPDQVTITTGGEIFGSDPIVVNGTLYAGTSHGRLWAKDLESIDAEFFQIDADNFNLGEIMYASGKLVMTSYDKSAGTGAKIFVYNQSDFDFENLNYEVELSSPYKTDGEYNAYLGQTHSHYIPDVDWSSLYLSPQPTPYATENKYKNAGYNFTALTEHNIIEPDPGVEGIMHIMDSEEDTQGYGGNHILALDINTPIDENLSDQERINQVVDQGGYAILAHPNSDRYRWDLKSVASLSNNNLGIEIYNKGIDAGGKYIGGINLDGIREKPYATNIWDKLISKMKLIWCTSGDDYTPGNPGFDGAGVVVFAKELTQEAIMQNLKNGNFYALQGSEAPRINIDVSENQITVNSDRASEIQFIGKDGRILQKTEDVTSSTYNVVGDELYVRAQVVANSKSAWTQPIFVSQKLLKSTSDIGKHYINLGQAKLISNNSDQVTAKVLPITEYPDSSPPLGYYSEIYSLYSQGDVYGGTKLAISYADKDLLTNANNLSLYVYSEADNVWQKINSTIDIESQIVFADLEHFSLYTLSADEPEDLENPDVELVSPTELTELSGEVDFEALASDNNAVVNIDYYLNDKLTYSDSDLSDGWIWPAELDNIANGEYELKIVAYDLSGNSGEARHNIVINSGLGKPVINIITPEENQNLEEVGAVSGSIESQSEINGVEVFIDDLFIGEVEAIDSKFNLDIDWDQFVEGEHILGVEVSDMYGNSGSTDINISIGAGIEATILSPVEDNYMQTNLINFSYETNSPEEIIAYLDDVPVVNGEVKYGYELGLGEHTYKLMHEEEVLDQREFGVTTNLSDKINLIMLLYNQGHIKNKGTRNSLIASIILLDQFDKRGVGFVADIIRRNTISWISRQSNRKIDNYAKYVLNTAITIIY